MQEQLKLQLKQAMLQGGNEYKDIMLILDLSEHAAKEMERMFMRVADTAPHGMQSATMLCILAMAGAHIGVLSEAAKRFFAEQGL